MKTESSIKKIVLGLCLFLIVAVMSTKMTSSVNAAELKKVDKPIDPPALVLENLKGEKIDLADYKGKVVLVQFWATYCIPCRTEMPSMNKLMHKLQEAKVPFEILAVDMGETKAEVQKFVDEVKPEFTMLIVSKDEQIEAWNVFATPSNFLIGTEGKIQYTLYGEFEWDSDAVVKTITELAAAKAEEDATETSTENTAEDTTENKKPATAKTAS
ncbi:MAG TPA: TlpA family protein disulfide reductase [Leucothrix sp.]|nr:TlpA family protein disulfide reductase [Leucothrix sp.]